MSVSPSSRVTIRFSQDEKARLEKAAGKLSLSAYIRQRLFGDGVSKRPKRHVHKQRQPSINHTEIARLLGTFGQSEVAQSILALNLALQAGEANVSAETEDKVATACDDLHEIKVALIMALGVKPKGEYSPSTKDRCSG